MPKQKRRNMLGLAILSLLQERPMHPYEVGATMRQRRLADTIKLNTGSLYAVIESLLKDKLIQPMGTEREGRHPERTIYEPTEKGKEELLDWLRSLLRTPVKEYTQFAAGLSFLAHLTPREAVELLEERAETLVKQVKDAQSSIEAVLNMGLDRLFIFEQEYSLVLLEAELNWLHQLIKAIESEGITKQMGDERTWIVSYKLPANGEDETTPNN